MKKKQIEYFNKQLHLANRTKLPIVIHCRGDQRTDELCLNCVTNLLPSTHRIHRHCFNGNTAMYRAWKTAFPSCKFGISPFLLLDDKYPDFRALVCEMKLEDLLIESDAPYLHPSSLKFGSPLLVRDIADKLANIFSCTVDEVAEITANNAVELYNLQ